MKNLTSKQKEQVSGGRAPVGPPYVSDPEWERLLRQLHQQNQIH